MGKEYKVDKSTNAITTLTYAHHEVHAGSYFSTYEHTTDIGAETAPADAIQITFTTPAVKEIHMIIHAQCTAAAVYTFTEAWTGGAGGGVALTAYNRDRNSDNKTTLTDLLDSNTAVVTGGTVLETQTLTTGKFDAGESRDAQEWILKRNTKYAIGLYLAAAETATISLNWYEHTNKTY